MIEITYVGGNVDVPVGADVPFNTSDRCGHAERFESDTNTLTLTKPGRYLILASANVAVPTATAPGPISLALTSNGSPIAGTVMTETPVLADTFFNVSAPTAVTVYGCAGKTISLRNVSAIPATINNQNIVAIRMGGGDNA